MHTHFMYQCLMAKQMMAYVPVKSYHDEKEPLLEDSHSSSSVQEGEEVGEGVKVHRKGTG